MVPAQKLAALHLIEGGQSDSKPILGQTGKVSAMVVLSAIISLLSGALCGLLVL
jgi:hypothetical protein